MSSTPLIEAAIRLKGSEAKLAEACGVSQAAIWKAKKAGRVSAFLAIRLERGTSGELPRWRLRPDLWDAPLSQASAPEAV